MEEKQSPEDPQTKGRSPVRSYASRVFQESSVGMVSSLAQTSSTRRRVFKVLALIACLTGFLYQTGQFLAVVFRYPTSVDIDIIRPEMLTVPGFTFCDNNGINRRIFCEKFPEHCREPDEAFCKKFEYYCDGNRSLVPKKEYYTLSSSLSVEEMAVLNVNLTDFVNVLDWGETGEVNGPFLRSRNFLHPNFLCYSLHDRVNSSLSPQLTEKNDLVKEAVNKLEFYVRPHDTFLPGNRPGILFAVHSPFQAVNPFETGIFMKPGRTYMLFVSMEEEILMQEPYDTNCVNYTEMWEKNGRAGPRLQDMCKQDCLADISMQCFNCVLPFIHFPRTERHCTEDDTEPHSCPDNLEELLEGCRLKCRDDCRRIKYSYNVQERFSPDFDSDDEIDSKHDHTIKVEVFLEGDEIIVLKHSPKYMIVEVFSNIGGFIGCWLGINLLDITDIFEGFFRIFRYSFKRR
uniref:Putative degenerin n=1 Tax=Cupiennius salei TaxID=6928 RepID=T1E1P4_CUPSA